MNERIVRAFVTSVALGCLAVGGIVTWHYPIAPAVVCAGFLAWTAISYRWPFCWLLIVPALLPVTGFATWTGWLTFEELDLWVLGAAAGGYARRAWNPPVSVEPGAMASSRPSFTVVLAVALFAISCAVSLYRGLIDAGGLHFQWIGSYDGSMNGVRLGKSLAMALLLWPPLRWALACDARRAIDSLAGGLAVGLAAASLAALWERAAFTGVLDFSSDYRTTALFWEMHVGGAALDGFLALTVPFAVWELRRNSGPLHLAAALTLAALATYACLTTFSRGVYLAVPLGLAGLALLLAAQRRSFGLPATTMPGWRPSLLVFIGVMAFLLVFRHGGYRALLAFLAALAVALSLGKARPQTLGLGVAALAAGTAIAVVGFAFATLVPKGAYVSFGVAWAANMALFPRNDVEQGWRSAALRWGAFAWLAAAAAGVAFYWGGKEAFVDSAIVLLALVARTIRDTWSTRPWIVTDPRSVVARLSVAGMLAAGVAVFSGGAYMGDRFSATGDDLETRIRHWRAGLAKLQGEADWWLGKGLGRFPANYLFDPPDGAFPGSYELHRRGSERFLTLAGPGFPTGWGELFRVAQRVPPASGTYTAIVEARATRDTQLHLEICEQHLLYNGSCATAALPISADPAWQQRIVTLDGRVLSRGPWYAPRLGFFALAVETSKQLIDVRSVALVGPDGRNVLVNADFADGMARWIPISEKFHLPWHIKNLALNVLFDQGIVGLTLFLLVVVGALWRLAFGAARHCCIAPFLAASLVGFIVVGMFDSLLDVPRVAFLFYVLVFLSFALTDGRAWNICGA